MVELIDAVDEATLEGCIGFSTTILIIKGARGKVRTHRHRQLSRPPIPLEDPATRINLDSDADLDLILTAAIAGCTLVVSVAAAWEAVAGTAGGFGVWAVGAGGLEGSAAKTWAPGAFGAGAAGDFTFGVAGVFGSGIVRDFVVGVDAGSGLGVVGSLESSMAAREKYQGE